MLAGLVSEILGDALRLPVGDGPDSHTDAYTIILESLDTRLLRSSFLGSILQSL